VVFGLLSGLSYAVVVLSLRRLKQFDSSWLISLNLLFTAAALAPAALQADHQPSGWQLAVLAAFGIIQLGVPYVLFARGMRSVSSFQASGIMLAEPLLVPVWVFLFRGDRPQPWTVAGAALIMTGLVLRIFWPRTAAVAE
jgi:drug/metabolite transporter (DMT)-like permease